MFVAAAAELVLVIVNSRVTESPAPTGSSMNSLVSVGAGATNRRSAAGEPTIPAPPTSAVTLLVVGVSLSLLAVVEIGKGISSGRFRTYIGQLSRN